ncbi:MAG: RnfABCDGE type electron transport complex subunit B [Gammaproteobacteria bacterium]|nr:RnfABCDGE type electron transport complex subunit B [Gammaproteobacteria bacterium]
MATLGLLLATLLIYANRRLTIFEDPLIDKVENLLPKANCGACGTPGCRAFAEKLVSHQLQPGKCTVNTPEMHAQIASLLGVDIGGQIKQVARLSCAGGNNVARSQGIYHGLDKCRAAQQLSGGGKSCPWGCLGLGDCVDVCNFNAIHINQYGLPEVNEEVCTACGDCVNACPLDLFSLQPISHQLWVACKNKEKGEAAESVCSVACTGCGRCALDAPEKLIEIKDNLAQIDYTKNVLASKVAIQRCPTGAIVWIEKGIEKGSQAKKIIRKEALPIS